MVTIRIRSSAGPYDVHCARGSLAKLRSLIAGLGESTGSYLLSSPKVWKFWGREVARRLGVASNRVILFDDSESRKR
ncbi:MAG TPA: hypothetical protein VFW94_18490, partial [Candidatus Acidoferrales bacterium]|nr:hypothetical protein [Candidatus Acidoferrales bacterium]